MSANSYDDSFEVQAYRRQQKRMAADPKNQCEICTSKRLAVFNCCKCNKRVCSFCETEINQHAYCPACRDIKRNADAVKAVA